MRKAVMPFVLSVGLIAVWATPANAASTRAEYIAQVDPICQSFVGPMGDAWGTFTRAFKRTTRAAKAGNTKAFLRAVKNESQSLNQLAATRASLIGQITALPPPEADAATIGTWLNHLRQEVAFESAGASANLKLQIGKYFRKLRQADKAERAGGQAISGFGFQVCGNPPVV
jgi:hypothetical protein